MTRNDDKPQYSRLFVVCSKSSREEDLRATFENFGEVEDVYMPRDHNTGQSRGIAYIKYAKTSAAATAIEKLHMTTLPNNQKPIKVMVASDKNDNSSNSRDKYKRLFVRVPKNMTESEIKQTFSNYGLVESVRIQKDRATEESKGFAYVNFTSFSDAAIALEECDKKYKAIFATPKEDSSRPRSGIDDNYPHSSGQMRSHSFHSSRDNFNNPMPLSLNVKPKDFDTVIAVCSPPVPQKYLEKLFSIVPVMIQFRYMSDQFSNQCRALVTYDTQQAAAYAVEALNNFEYPSGQTVSVTPDSDPLSKAACNLNSIVNNIKNSVDGNSDLMQLAEMIAQASSLIKSCTSGRENLNNQDDSFCNVSLPPMQPLASSNSRLAQRCFLVFKPHPPPLGALKDAFCRFGNLIDIVTFPNKTFAYARYASVSSAQEAIRTLHGATICGVYMKVMEAEERNPHFDSDNDSERKRMQATDDRDSKMKRIKLTNNDN